MLPPYYLPSGGPHTSQRQNNTLGCVGKDHVTLRKELADQVAFVIATYKLYLYDAVEIVLRNRGNPSAF